jgi:hypothetical protein
MCMEGDAPEGQPAEGVDALDDLAEALDPTPEAERAAPDGDGEESEEQEVGEAEEESGEDDSDEADDDAEDDQEEPTIVLKHEGKEVSLKQSEVVELAQKGFDYTAKTMAVAEERKAAEAEKAKASELRQSFEDASTEAINRLTAYTEFLEADLGEPPPVSLAAEDAHLYLARKEQHEQKKGKLQGAYAQIRHVQDEQARQRQAWIAEAAASTEAALKDTLPGWSDKTLAELADYSKQLGLTPQSAELAMLIPGFWQMAQKAKSFDAIQERKAQMKPVQKLAKVAKPAASNTNGKVAERAKREAAFNKNPSVDALAELLR